MFDSIPIFVNARPIKSRGMREMGWYILKFQEFLYIYRTSQMLIIFFVVPELFKNFFKKKMTMILFIYLLVYSQVDLIFLVPDQ